MNGYIYLIVSEAQNAAKIGYSADFPSRRLVQLQTGNPDKLRLSHCLLGDRGIEGVIQGELSAYRLGLEWFRDVPLMSAVFDALDGDSMNDDDEQTRLTADMIRRTIAEVLAEPDEIAA